MASVELTFQQILDAARQLPAAQQKNLVKAIASRPSPDEVRKVARRLRPTFRLSPKKRKRMSNLGAKRSAGTLTAAERAELNGLVDEVTENNLRFAQAVADSFKSSSTRNGPATRMARR